MLHTFGSQHDLWTRSTIASIFGPALNPVLMDSNFFGAFTNRSVARDFHDLILATAPEPVLRPLNTGYNFWRTPFSFIEWLGVSTGELAQPCAETMRAFVAQLSIPELLQWCTSHYRKQSELQQGVLRARAQTQLTHLSRRQIPMVESMLEGIFESGAFVDWICTALAFDRIHTFTCKQTKVMQKFNDGLLRESFASSNLHVRNLSKLRLARRLWTANYKVLRDHEYPNFSEVDAAISSLSEVADHLDTDLVHAATYGAECDWRPRCRVVAYTCDQPWQIKGRICAYRALFLLALKQAPDSFSELGMSEDYQSTYNGTIHCFDSKGRFVETIVVQEHTFPIGLHELELQS